ncbi:4-oxalocrotonate tautomerase family protein [Pectobacterium quasiaquaticum]|uniref:Tautomerase n=1 Tax=Pectobacterium quasiaquaticum TaxID=2774015 RepID=A0A9Q2EXH2_9GAMM|nr:4-oxalocrotonate tautomerase family protein [Pectobacterium quasiaquaticum]MBE5202380.1 4-oxalocrotonate tautomerase family protein [Pectobacterium quasiaquaticum]MBE5208621.1 4-oxalocrotonate tautomerase family protein [Pectobacterium quasiaquaticum]MBE5214157.1 4-oxalocrotonate tautomerase family protein [Pectobacterium quasiaquaticum]MBE5219966.1 4-oxalocrotonate tautomerase family protein [Pectobacterium quasiaquaticum]MBE5226357.1 4-oxalocrotonate tautomerase family protein [Pectobacte
MPYVNIKVTQEGVTAEQKRQLIEGVTELLHQVLNKPPGTTFVVIDEIPTDNWGVGGETVTSLRQKEKIRLSSVENAEIAGRCHT